MGVLSVAVVAGAAVGFSLKGVPPPPTTIEAVEPAYESTDIFLGDPDAPIAITEFTDLYCPTCRSQHAWLMQSLGRLIESGRIKLIVRHYPLPDLHPLAIEAALFAIWAQEKGKFWEFFEAAHQIEDKENKALLLAAVQAAGLDPVEAQKLLDDKELRAPYVAEMQKDIDDAGKLRVEATPSWIVDYADGQRQFAVGSGIQKLIGDPKFQEAIK
jgi:protein-disulfide isomerase